MMNPRGLAAAMAACLVLSACGGDDDSAPQTLSCADLTGLSVQAKSIGLPTQGAVVISATDVAPTAAGAKGYCMVAGRILPVDAQAPDIRFNLALPSDWNGKAVMYGGGGTNGTIPVITGNPLNTLAIAATPLARGYAVFASDSGHQSTAADAGIDASSFVNAEAAKNWYGDALKKTRDTADAIIRARYGRAQTSSYFLGSSTGGREALTVATRWPADWDGAVAQYPARPTRAMGLALVNNSRALAAPGAFPNTARRGLLHTAALAACDALDGVSDGLISNAAACNTSFDPATARLNGAALRCPTGGDEGDTCLSDPQLAALKAVNSRLNFGYTLDSGESSYPGYNAYIADMGSSLSNQLDQGLSILSLGIVAPAFPATASMGFQIRFADQDTRFIVVGNASFNYLSLDPLNPGPYLDVIKKSSTDDVTATTKVDLSGFASRGGRLIITHGTDDMLISPRASEEYVQRMRATMGSAKVDEFLRYYEIAGFAHSVGRFMLAWDPLTVLEQWREKGIDPANNIIITDLAGVPGRTRPLCIYPSWPKYSGTGSVNAAASFVCATQ